MAANNSNSLVDEKLAVSLFLDSLLHEPEDEIDFPEPEIKAVIGLPTVEITPTQKVEAPIIETPAETKIDVKIKEEVSVESAEDASVATEAESLVAESAVPEWASEPFQVLLFEVAGLKLAVPLVGLSGVIKWTDTVTEMPGHADFYMGILLHLKHKIAVIDTARMVLPANKLAQFAGDNARQRVNHIVLIDDYRWGLACDKIGEVITLQPDEVRWRTSKTSRDWLAGTVIEHMCALLNSEGFSAMLEKGSSVSN